MPSHYRHKETKKLYLQETFGSFSELHKLYQQHCKSSNQKSLSRNTLRKYLKEKNIGIFSPRQDQCDLCLEYQAGNLDQEKWEKHRQDKKRAQQEKVKDKEDANNFKFLGFWLDLKSVPIYKQVRCTLKLNYIATTLQFLILIPKMPLVIEETDMDLKPSFCTCIFTSRLFTKKNVEPSW